MINYLVLDIGGECLPALTLKTGEVTQCPMSPTWPVLLPEYRSPMLCLAGRGTRAGEMMKGTLSLFLLVLCLAGAVGWGWLLDLDLLGGLGGVLVVTCHIINIVIKNDFKSLLYSTLKVSKDESCLLELLYFSSCQLSKVWHFQLISQFNNLRKR